MRTQSPVNLSTIFLIIGIMMSEVGKLTQKLTTKARSQISQKFGTKPTFISVRARDMKKDIPNDTKAANKTV